MLKTVAAAATALVIAGGSMVYAQQRGAMHDGPRHWRPTAEDISAFTDARIAALKAGLELTPDQEKDWPALEKALRDNAKLRSERFAARASADKPDDIVARWKTRGEMMTQSGNSLKAMAEAAQPLYQSLNDAQKRRFAVLVEVGMHHRFGHHRHHERMMRDHDRGGPDGQMGPSTEPDQPKPQQ
jgi:hypothetical protein